MREWCRRITEATGVPWHYIRVNQTDFRPDFATLRELVFKVTGNAMFLGRDRRNTTMSRKEVRQALDGGPGLMVIVIDASVAIDAHLAGMISTPTASEMSAHFLSTVTTGMPSERPSARQARSPSDRPLDRVASRKAPAM